VQAGPGTKQREQHDQQPHGMQRSRRHRTWARST
jgi:hypothetical protein